MFVLVGENKDINQITTSGTDPYIMGTLKPNSAWFTGYNYVTTGSLADYIALTSGQHAPCQRKGLCGKFDEPNIFAEATAAGMSWQAWNESTPSNSTLEIRCTSTRLAVGTRSGQRQRRRHHYFRGCGR